MQQASLRGCSKHARWCSFSLRLHGRFCGPGFAPAAQRRAASYHLLTPAASLMLLLVPAVGLSAARAVAYLRPVLTPCESSTAAEPAGERAAGRSAGGWWARCQRQEQWQQQQQQGAPVPAGQRLLGCVSQGALSSCFPPPGPGLRPAAHDVPCTLGPAPQVHRTQTPRETPTAAGQAAAAGAAAAPSQQAAALWGAFRIPASGLRPGAEAGVGAEGRGEGQEEGGADSRGAVWDRFWRAL